MTETKLSSTAERLLFEHRERELLKKLILALADHPQVSYCLWKHKLIYEKEEMAKP